MGCTNDGEKKPNNKKSRRHLNNSSSNSNSMNNNDNYRNHERRMMDFDDENEQNERKSRGSEKKEKSDEEEEDSEDDSGNINNNNNEENDNDNNESDDEEDEEIVRNENNEIIRGLEPYLQAREDPNFNFPEVKDKYVGKGLKKMKGYISNITKEELDKRRVAFWGTRVEGNEQTWHFLKEICEMPPGDEAELEAMLSAYDLKPYKNCINITYDASGTLYEIPNYCIHDPVSYDFPESHKKKPPEKKIVFKGRYMAKEIKLKSSNYNMIKKIRTQIAKKLKTTNEKVRLFFSGKELKNEFELWTYGIDSDCIIMIMVSP